MILNRISFFFALAVWALLAGCFKTEHVNPYDRDDDDVVDPTPGDSLDLSTFAGLHAGIFRPTCANSGCHDGTFEPDFRTVQSTYNTLVMHPIIKNDPQGSFSYRVVPGNPSASLLIARLTYDIDGNSGLMPLAVEPGSDWFAKRDIYIDHIKKWIENGANNAF